MNYNLSGLIEINSCYSFKDYIKKIYQFPILTEQQEHDLAYDWAENKNKIAAQQLITSHLRLVVKMAMLYKYRGCNLPVMDLISEGTIGLVEAVKRFELGKKCRFATYAMFYIKAKINDFIRDAFSLVKLSTARVTKKLFSKYKEIANSVSDEDLEKIANEVGTSVKNVHEMKTRIICRDYSLDQTYNDDYSGTESGQSSLSNTIASCELNPEEVILEKDEKDKYYKAIAYACLHFLDHQEKDIIANRILANEKMKLKELADKYGVSQERIRQKQEGALKKIRKYLKEQNLLDVRYGSVALNYGQGLLG